MLLLLLLMPVMIFSQTTPLMTAIKEGFLDEALPLITADKDTINAVSENGDTALTLASYYDQWRLIDPLIKNGADINYTNAHGNALNHSAQFGLQRVVTVLVKAGIEVDALNSKNQTPLVQASENGFDATVKYLLKYTSTHKDMALYYAVKNDHIKVVNMLIKAGADPNVITDDGETLIALASKSGSTNSLKVLMQSGDIHFVDKDGNTALNLASEFNQFHTSVMLLNAGADVNHQNHKGETSLHTASYFEFEILAKLLMAYEADPLIKNQDDITPLDIVTKERNKILIELYTDDR